MRTTFKAPGGTLVLSAVAGQVVVTITDGITSKSIAFDPHIADAVAGETLRTATFAERQPSITPEAQQAHRNVIGFPVGAAS